MMAEVLTSDDYTIEIPEEIRRKVSLTEGQKVQVFAKNGIIIVIPDQPLAALRGFLKGMNIQGVREKPSRF
jgi:bifunctional DNA-binding transcriptional regulator/antitoxin component of YhaV-PrlF toxin-antitoxin module